VKRLTARERQMLAQRIALTLRWHASPLQTRQDALRDAERVIDALTEAGLTAATLRRATEKVIDTGLALVNGETAA
jgi:hypothetical protein